MTERRRWSVCVAGGRRRVVAGLAAVLALGGGGVASAGTAAASLPVASMPRASVPRASAGSVYLSGVAAVPGTEDAIAVGGQQASGPARPVAYRWTGSAWQAMALPRQLAAGSSLSGVWAASPSDAWAVGSGSVGPVVLHWDGRAWSEVAVSGLSRSTSLVAVSGSSPGDVWAVGATFRGGPGSMSVSPVGLHYNGRSWVVSHAAPAGVGLFRVSVVSPSDVWALGSSANGRSSSLAHFDGRTWTVVGLPGASGATLSGVGASGPSAWVVGAAGTSLVSWHLAGGRWTKVAMPPPERGKVASASAGVVALAGGTAWTAGIVAGTAFSEHLAGGRWTVVRVPPGGNGASLDSISAAGPRDVWAVGGSFVGAVCRSPARPLAYHFVSAWKAAPFAGSGAAVARIQPDC